MTTIAIIAPGNMGAALGRRLGDGGHRVVTSLGGRSAASRDRAAAAGMADADDAAIAASDLVLAVLPPSEALALAERLRPALAAVGRKPVYADCNAVSPETVQAIAARLAGTGCPFVDVGIVGPPPRAETDRTILYAAGDAAGRLGALEEAGLTIRRLPGPIGAASALKMSYAGITKGLTALGTAMALAASKAGVGDELARELVESQPALTAWLKRQTPGMFGKAYRWVGEMEEIARFLDAQHGPGALYRGAATLYDGVARDFAAEKGEIALVETFLNRLG